MAAQPYPQIDGYTILQVIGQGGMSTVYLAEQQSLGRRVALKVMLAEVMTDDVVRTRFENEARTIARLEHPNIVGIHEVGRTADGLPFYSMPYLSRGHLAQRKLAGEQAQVAAVLRALLQALDYAHVRGVVHRDVKAENVLFDDTDRPMLADFGIAQQRGSNPRLTDGGLAVGSTAYMAPEQARGRDVDRRADLYSVGVLAWEMLVGQLPYSAGDALSMAVKHMQDPIPRLPASLKHWQPLIDRAMAKRPEDRYASARDMLDALNAVEQRAGRAFGTVEVPAGYVPPATAAAVPAPPARGKLLRAAVLGIALVAVAGIGYLGWKFMFSVPSTESEAGAMAPAQTPPPPAPDTATPPVSTIGQGIGAYLANADQQLRNGHLLAPANANAWDSLEAAWRVNPTNPITLHLTAQLFDALSADAERALRDGDVGTARGDFEHARTLDERRGGTGVAVDHLRTRLADALDARVTTLLARGDGSGAGALLADCEWLGLDTKRHAALQARVAAADDASGTAETGGSGRRNGGRGEGASAAQLPAVTIIAVTRADYARFAAAVGRAPADCGRRLFRRRPTWSNTGRDNRPVVCVSADDAQAYARWRSGQGGGRYRLPSAGELRRHGQLPIAGWMNLCADSACARRMAAGKSRPLDADRGYDDVGILLTHVK